jgi:anti-sigma factor ChrR (cupin superfamily)
MKINSDISKRVVIQQATLPWIDTPWAGVQYRALERGADDAARATSIIRYAPGSCLSSSCEFGEEIVVLDGVLTDEFGSYRKGDYLKNPPGSSRACESASGCMLFVKQHHLEIEDDQRIVVESATKPWYQGLVDGLSVMPLSEFGTRHTALVRWAPGTRFNAHRHFGGEEIYVLDGVFEDEFGRYPAGSWMRSPHLSAHCPFSLAGCTIFVKTGHLLPLQREITAA